MTLRPPWGFLRLGLALCLMAAADALTAPLPSSRADCSPRVADPIPHILYWIWTPSTIKDDGFLKDLDRVAAKSPFSLVAVYLHGGFGFNDPEAVKPALAKAVKHAHELGLKLMVSPYYPGHSPDHLKGRLHGILLDGETTLDVNGAGTLEVKAETQSNLKPASSSLVKAYTFRKTGEGTYDPTTLHELKEGEIIVTPVDTDALQIKVKPDALRAGQTLFTMSRHDYAYGDLFTDFFPEQFKKMLDTWAEIPLDGVALDEFRYLTLNKCRPFHGRWYSQPMANAYKEHYGRPMEEDLLAYRYVPEGHPEQRAAAINRYFDLLCQRPAEIDRFVMEYARKLFGPGTFKGFHNTWHNRLVGDEIWGTGANWWGLDRDYGQLDEQCCAPVRLGVEVAYPKPVFYNMFYNKKPDAYFDEAVSCARINGRVHYLGLNQPAEWGIPMDDAFLERVKKVEDRIRLLNLFDGSRPDTKLLVLFGMPSLANWFPDATARSDYDINKSLKSEEKVMALWKAGIPCALLSTTLIDSGKLMLNKEGKPTINGHTFDAVVFIGPEYSKPSTLAFLKNYVDRGGKLLLDGKATRGFDGKPVGADAGAIAKAAVARDATPASVAKLGLSQDWPKEGCRLEDGSVMLADRSTIETDEPHEFSFTIGKHQYKALASGVLAFKESPDGKPLKLIAARLVSLSRDGDNLYAPKTPSDTAIEWTTSGIRPLTLESTQTTSSTIP